MATIVERYSGRNGGSQSFGWARTLVLAPVVAMAALMGVLQPTAFGTVILLGGVLLATVGVLVWLLYRLRAHDAALVAEAWPDDDHVEDAVDVPLMSWLDGGDPRGLTMPSGPSDAGTQGEADADAPAVAASGVAA